MSNKTKATVEGFKTGIAKALAAGNKPKADFLTRSMYQTMKNGK